jgi:hypothetical protein
MELTRNVTSTTHPATQAKARIMQISFSLQESSRHYKRAFYAFRALKSHSCDTPEHNIRHVL